MEREHGAGSQRPRFGIGSVVRHARFGAGRVVDYRNGSYVILFRGGETRDVAFGVPDLEGAGDGGEADLDRLKRAVREVLGDYGWIDVELELGKRWVGGVVRLVPGNEATQSKEIPVEVFFRKLIGIRDKLRVLEQKVTSHPALSPEEKLELTGYVTRCYGSLTTFNALFGAEAGRFKGQAEA